MTNRYGTTEPVGTNVEDHAIHRIIERHAVIRGDAVAVAGDHYAMTYRSLNQRANGVARRLHDVGFRRGGHAAVRMRRTPDLAIMLLAVLKAGGAYSWDDARHTTVSIALTHVPGSHTRCVDVDALLHGSSYTSANLPIVTRGTDIACVLQDLTGDPALLVPHATVTSLCAHGAPANAVWDGDAAALDLWFVLMAGGTAVLNGETAQVAA